MPPAKGSLVAILFVTVVEKLASSPNAAASSLSVSNVLGAESTRLDTAVCTKAVVASCVVFVVAPAVGAVGVPVKAGDAKGAAPN